jgi:hypothetical protein
LVGALLIAAVTAVTFYVKPVPSFLAAEMRSPDDTLDADLIEIPHNVTTQGSVRVCLRQPYGTAQALTRCNEVAYLSGGERARHFNRCYVGLGIKRAA